MNRGAIRARMLKRIDRSDSTTSDLIDAMIIETIRTIEESYPFYYNKKSQSNSLAPANGFFTLPPDLILHHKFALLIKINSATELTLDYMVKVGDESFALNFTQPEVSGDAPEYWRLAGGNNALTFQVTPVQDEPVDVRVFGGYFYSPALTGDSDSNWLTNSCSDLVLEGVAAKLFEHYGEHQKSDRAYSRYLAYLNGDLEIGIKGVVKQQKKMRNNGKLLRVKTLDDLPDAIARKKKYVGY